ncbi:MAG TPA: FAD-dependent oxidoreductase [Polyangiaceae bacterium]|nr:FAD-dependent oxidoreductase [Polyangiaceae bacterium]
MSTKSPPVVVLGAGLAGLTAAIHLAERGVDVVLCEAHPTFLGGRTRAREPYAFRWKGQLYTHSFDHGQHCMWAQYWNMRAMLDRLGILAHSVRPCETTGYLFDDGRTVHRLAPFDVNPSNLQPTLLHFLRHLMRAVRVPGWSPADSLKAAMALPRLAAMCSFAHERHYEVWDELSLQDLFVWMGLPAQLEQVLKSMGKASTFHRHCDISASWGLSMMESTMIGHPDDHKMWCFRGNLGTHLIDPLAQALRARGGAILRNATAAGLERDADRIRAILLEPTASPSDGRSACSSEARERTKTLDADVPLSRPLRLPCAHVVSALDIGGFQRWALPALADLHEIRGVANMEAIGSIAVRVVTAHPVRLGDPPMGIFAGAFRLLDTYFRLSTYQDEFAEFRARTGGEVLELHAYLASRELAACTPATVRALVEREILRAWPELRDAVVHVAVGCNERTFDKHGVGHARFEPRMKTSLANLLLCGSWIRTSEAVHDMEKAVVTGLRAANTVLEEHSLAPFEVRRLRPPSSLQRLAALLGPILPRPPALRSGRPARGGPNR